MIDSDYAANFLPVIAAYIKGEAIQNTSPDKQSTDKVAFATLQASKYFVTPHSSFYAPEDAPEDSVAVMAIRGAITKHSQFCGPAGMVAQANLLDRCYANDNIKGIVIVTESGGGEAYAMQILNEAIARKNKPVVGFIDDFSASAAYGIISGCDQIVANRTLARVGSIGAYQTIVDHTEYFKNKGINLIEIYATASKDKNGELREALNGNLEPLRKMVDVFNESFLSQVETNRTGKLKTERKDWGTGKIFFADEALKHGLIDRIDSFENVLNYF
ncbi:S49 family peptidase [Dysgonomonas sp. Marseille-P4677]|uniref:S49 family peptidase n=1 Tax=Dysgonomonas sp. Marseille-P4677 TaxID=2364790 RepID=UPI001F32ECDC|nr:S49 family peptidase [Dysgonomonas sp. Marseille-P4677]